MPLSRDEQKESDKFLTGEEAKVWRLSRDLTQADVAKFLGITPQAVSKSERSGVSRAVALAYVALDHRLKPYKPTQEDYEAANNSRRRK